MKSARNKTIEVVTRACRAFPEISENLRDKAKPLIKSVLNRMDGLSNASSGTDEGEEIFQVLDFFCGAGGTSIGFSSVGQIVPSYRIVGGCDINPIAAETFSMNMKAPGVVADIRKLTNRNAMRSFLSQTNYNPHQELIVIGCAPCQGFSSHRKKKWNEEDSRNDLPECFARVATSLNPACILMENVPELLSEKYWCYFEKVRSIFMSAGYVVKQAIYNTATFGVPQERYRATVIAMRRDFQLPPALLRPEQYLTVRDAISDLPKVAAGETCSTDQLHRSANHKDSTLEVIRAVPHNGGNRPQGIGPKCLDKVSGYYDVYGRLSWDKPAITITQYARNPASGRFTHPELDRGLTAREAARLQSFPDYIEFHGCLGEVFQQIGEAVPPRFAAAIASSILLELLSPPLTEAMQAESIVGLDKPVSSSFSSVIAGRKIGGASNGLYVY